MKLYDFLIEKKFHLLRPSWSTIFGVTLEAMFGTLLVIFPYLMEETYFLGMILSQVIVLVALTTIYHGYC